jgi:hypothetical protein
MSAEELGKVAHRSSWSKDIVVWIGSDSGLAEAVRGVPAVSLDLLDLVPDTGDIPVADSERADLLRSRLDARLRQIREQETGRVILCVSNIPLLSRYRVGLRPFFDWFTGSQKMVILVMPGEMQEMRLPTHLEKDIRLDCADVIDYFDSCLRDPRSPHHIFREK